jgi:hypothetical protein
MSAGHAHDASDFVPRRYVVAEFPSAEALIAGTRKVREAGHKALDTHTPYPLHGLDEALGLGRPMIPKIVLGGAITGAITAYALIYFCNVIDFPINIGNRPPHSPLTNIPITFELAVLFAGLSSFLGFFTLARLPRPYHPVFESEAMASRASIDGFFLSVELPEGTTADKAMADVREAGATHVEYVEEAER